MVRLPNKSDQFHGLFGCAPECGNVAEYMRLGGGIPTTFHTKVELKYRTGKTDVITNCLLSRDLNSLEVLTPAYIIFFQKTFTICEVMWHNLLGLGVVFHFYCFFHFLQSVFL